MVGGEGGMVGGGGGMVGSDVGGELKHLVQQLDKVMYKLEKQSCTEPYSTLIDHGEVNELSHMIVCNGCPRNLVCGKADIVIYS